ncbi:hypothetical protein [Anaerobiospirillum sp. NML120449]|uniref:hypothetical protein n=1 Tax=Anaerobiospirillum sp. NML120449 TaxID=2932817 RepID=UPI001FF356A3|nr:hypothetical protein [Anaerobiospirillum sp. NML120449]MCK0525913.1 hypothetical protein [Anaerobiospirillum sp. NML120449]
MKTTIEFSVLFNGNVRVREQNTQIMSDSGLSDLDHLIMTTGITLENASLLDVDNGQVDECYACICNYEGDVLISSDKTCSQSHVVTALTCREWQNKTSHNNGILEDFLYLSPDFSPAQRYTYKMLQVPVVIKVQADNYYKNGINVLNAIRIRRGLKPLGDDEEFHALRGFNFDFSSRDEHFAAWLESADKDFMIENMIMPVFLALGQEDDGIASITSLVDMVKDLESLEDLAQLNSRLKRFNFKVTLSSKSQLLIKGLVPQFLNQRYGEKNDFDQLSIEGFEWLDEVREFCEIFNESGLTGDLLNHRGLAYLNNIELLMGHYCSLDERRSLENTSLIKETIHLRKLLGPVFSRYEDSPEFRSLTSNVWYRADHDTVDKILSYDNAVHFDKPLAVVDAEFLMGNYLNIRQAVRNRTIVIPATVLASLICHRFHFDVAMSLIANHAQRAVIELGETAVYYVPDFNLTSMFVRTAADGSEGNSGTCRYSCISTAICLQAYDTVLYTGNQETARKAEKLGVKTVFSDSVNDLYSKQAQLRDQSITILRDNDDYELRRYEELELYTYDKSLSLIKTNLNELSWGSCYMYCRPELPEELVNVMAEQRKQRINDMDHERQIRMWTSHYGDSHMAYFDDDDDCYVDEGHLNDVASMPLFESIYRKPLLAVHMGRTDLSRELIDKRMLITTEGMKKWAAEGGRDGLISPDESLFVSPGMKNLLECCRSIYDSSKEQFEGGDS